MIPIVEFKNKTGNGDMKTSARPQGPSRGRPSHRADSGTTEQTDRHLTLALTDDHPHKERGYNPYDTTAYARDAKLKDVWQHKPKRT
jgi:hypothetical protein